jgi:hypothetical protein
LKKKMVEANETDKIENDPTPSTGNP